MVWEILLALLGAIGLAACLRFAAGRLLYPVRGALIVLPARGDAQGLEHQLKGLSALSRDGQLAGETVLVADLGLSPEGRAAAERLCRRYPALTLVTPEREDNSDP